MQNNFVFFLNDVTGGVASVVNNLLKYISVTDTHFRVILTYKSESDKEAYRIKSFSSPHAVERFVYHRNENVYAICKRLRKLIEPDDVIIANDWLELGMVSNLGLQNKVIYILHGDYDYYYELAEIHQSAIDAFICVSKHIENKLKSRLPSMISDICYLPHAIPEINAKIEYNFTKPLSIIFIGRLTAEKGYHRLPDINTLLLKKNILVNWYIAGVCANKNGEEKRWNDATNVHFMGNVPNDLLLSTICQYDLFILPSHAEGFPVTLVESMKAGLVPLVSNLPSGIPELVENGITGYVFAIDDVEAYAITIASLNKNRKLLETIGRHASKKANERFNPFINAKTYENSFMRIQEMHHGVQKKAHKVYGSRLDHRFIPNSITKLIRHYLHSNKL